MTEESSGLTEIAAFVLRINETAGRLQKESEDKVKEGRRQKLRMDGAREALTVVYQKIEELLDARRSAAGGRDPTAQREGGSDQPGTVETTSGPETQPDPARGI